MERKAGKFGRGSYLLLAIMFVVLAIGTFNIYEERQARTLIDQRYGETADHLVHTFRQMLRDKQKTTTALALTLAQGDDLETLIGDPALPRKYFDAYVLKMRQRTPYKNVWIELVDPSGRSIYRSWSDIPVEKALPLPGEKGVEIAEGLFVNRSDLVIAASVPIKAGGRLRVLTHFNSIAKALARQDVRMIVFVTPYLRNVITEPFGSHAVGQYYIALQALPRGVLATLDAKQTERLCHAWDKVYQNDELLITQRLSNAYDTQVGCVVLAKPFSKVHVDDIAMFKLRNVLIFASIGGAVLLGLAAVMFGILRHQRRYFKEILDTASNIVVVTDGRQIVDVNRTFFEYFNDYTSLSDFRQHYSCICDLFEGDDLFIQPEMEGMSWVDYLLEHPKQRHLVKIVYKDDVFIFRVQASRLAHSSPHRLSVIFTEITREWENEKKLERLSLTDPLTGIFNRRYFDRKFADELNRAERYAQPLSLILFDIDWFKQINDHLGHETGDEVLQHLTRYVQLQIREHDRLCRVGGEEFAIILPETTVGNAAQFAERIRRGVERNFSGVHEGLTISLGVHECRSGEDAKSAYGAVDDALYAAKNAGRNCVREG